MTIIGLYTSRVVLQVLGVSDYGVYNAVGGAVTMLSILSASLSTAISRYLTFELGKGDDERLKKVFSTSFIVQVLMALIVIIIGGVLGWWFLNTHMNIPAGRMGAANWVLFFSLFTFAVNLINVPYNASIVSHEKMDVYAYMSIVEALLKLVVVFTLFVSPLDKLKTYAVLLFAVSLVTRYIYMFYCHKHFEECRHYRSFDVKLLKEMSSFAGWNFLGNAAWTFNTQGINILVNIFFGVTLNAARGIATQINALVRQFVSNFMMALNPQITKSYAAGDLKKMHELVFRGARFSFYLMLFFAVPCCIETEKILLLWLTVVPDYTVLFVRLSFLSSMIMVMGNTLVTAQLATGKIKKYQIVMTICGVWVFPMTWLAFKLGGDASWAYTIFCVFYFFLIIIRMYMVKDLINLPCGLYTKEVIIKPTIVGAIAFIVPLCVHLVMPPTTLRMLVVVALSFIYTGCVTFFLGLTKEEKPIIVKIIKEKLLRRKTNHAKKDD